MDDVPDLPKKASKKRKKTPDRKAVGLKIRNFRWQKELTQSDLAELAGIHPTYLGSIERGERNVSMEMILKISRVLHCSPKDLMPD